MLLDVCLGTRSAWKILFVFNEAPGKAISRKEIKNLTGLGNKVLSKFLLLLEKFELVTSVKIKNAYYYKLNLSSPYLEHILGLIRMEKKSLNNPDFIVLNILREFVYELTNLDLENLARVVLFGSYAKRTYNADSDIDLALVFKLRDAGSELLIVDVIDRLKKRFGKEIQPHYYSVSEFEAVKKSKLALEIVKDGIALI
ncbi:nucleotidyltransferase domain-containing protein [Candidatus Woesearchaeota archaeon]|nr:nucleotidyltransferase domain-containing protein [Candidatus Woesearchaeota archaeon]